MTRQQAERKNHAEMRMMRGPGSGARRMMLGQVQKAKNVQGTLRRVWNYLQQQRLGLAEVVGLVCLTTGFNITGPYLMGMAIDQYMFRHDLKGLTLIAVLMILVYTLATLTTWLQIYLMSALAQRVVRDIRHDLFAKLQTLVPRFFDERPHGELMSRLTNDVENISNVLSEGVTQFIASLLTITGVALMMLWLNRWLAVVSLVTVPLMGFLTKWVVAHTRQGFREQQRTLGVLNGLIEETITGARVVKAYGREQATFAAFDQANEHLRVAAITAQTYSLLLFPLTNFVNNAGFAIVAGVGGWMALRSLATVGVIASFLSYTRQFGHPLNQIAGLYNSIQSALAGAERIFEILDEVPELSDDPEAKPLNSIQGDIVFHEVNFSYKADIPVLKQVNLHAQPGQVIALVGPTGAGKTTIVNVLMRFYDIDSGTILIDGKDIRHVQKASLRCQLGIVLQDTFLFSASVMENIRYGRLDATDEEVFAAAKIAEVDHFIRRLPQGYATLLSERGSNLSQGQRQLLAIARAVLSDPGILILDEATSSVDTRTEVQIQRALLRLMQGRTSFVIAHRLSTIRNADQVLVIHEGRIVEHGTHDALLRQHGLYANLYMSQFKG
ncbi:ABC transporter related protein [Candidatus Vecturithrix granuli]|uniref:ABC transporter related protein n=1 Tax=Vecturithrix granuli TaxID=1499967 RepID=A0A081C677_VECG1|nr:ABC transporter related protein [Candidatus Vecturithrix granuli]